MLSMRLQAMREKTRSGTYRQHRTSSIDFHAVEEECASLPRYRAAARQFSRVLDAETPVIVPGERFQFTRSLGCQIPTFPGAEDRRLRARFGILENLSPDWELLLRDGLSGRIAAARKKLETVAPESESAEFLRAAILSLENVAEFAGRYADKAESAGEPALAALLRRVPQSPAKTLHEALQSVYFLSAMIRLSGAIHVGFARIDRYLLPFYRADLAAGRQTRESAAELFAEFFLMLNRDNDLFHGMQPGDNGQSMMLGGCSPDGEPADNELTELLLEVSADLAMIEPKLNLRVSSRTSPEVLRAAARLSGCGLGFPQYCNDEVVIPGLAAFGYPLENARGYTVAACWEFVTKNGRDVPNIYSMNLPLAVDRAIRNGLRQKESYRQILDRVPGEIRTLFREEQANIRDPFFLPNPLFSSFCGECLNRGKDLHFGGGDHFHYGCHGCGSSSAADSLAAVGKLVFEEKTVAPEELLEALEHNFEGFEALRERLREDGPKVGCGDAGADECLRFVFDAFADVLAEVKDNGRGGRVRPGTGSAYNYVAMTQNDGPNRLRATADGRRDGEYISSSLSPAPGVRPNGILSVLNSYGKLDYRRLCNGGPITMELDPGYFHSPEAIEKMTALIKAFVRSGCQQLQLNVLDANVLRHAQQFPEQHRDLVVRVWGWSGYFVELAKAYQDQIIGRQAYRG